MMEWIIWIWVGAWTLPGLIKNLWEWHQSQPKRLAEAEDLADAIADQEHREAIADFDRRLGVVTPAPEAESTPDGDMEQATTTTEFPPRLVARRWIKPLPQMPRPGPPRNFNC